MQTKSKKLPQKPACFVVDFAENLPLQCQVKLRHITGIKLKLQYTPYNSPNTMMYYLTRVSMKQFMPLLMILNMYDNAWMNCSFELSTLRSYNTSGAPLWLYCFASQYRGKIGLTDASLPKDDYNNHLF